MFQNLSRYINRGKLLFVKNSPEILIGLGIAGFITTVVLACKATTEVSEVVRESKKEVDFVKEQQGNIEEKELQRQLTIVYGRRAVEIVRLYGPAIATGVVSIGCMIGSNRILNRRNAGLLAAYKVIDESFKGYRKRVRDQFGEEKEREIRFDLIDEPAGLESSDGEEKKIQKYVPKKMVNPGMKSDYARVFNADNPNWQRNYEYNLFFLKSVQNWANERLKGQGHMFLNEVYDMLSIPRSWEGQMVGWVWNGDFDNCIDIGILDPENDPKNKHGNNPYDDYFLLDFNVDGVIYGAI